MLRFISGSTVIAKVRVDGPVVPGGVLSVIDDPNDSDSWHQFDLAYTEDEQTFDDVDISEQLEQIDAGIVQVDMERAAGQGKWTLYLELQVRAPDGSTKSESDRDKSKQDFARASISFRRQS